MPPKRKRVTTVEEDDDQDLPVEPNASIDVSNSVSAPPPATTSATTSNTSHAQKIEQSHQSFAYTVAKLCEEYDKASVTSEAVKTISYYTSLYLQQIVAKDLKSFAQHRTKQESTSEKVLIKSKDVFLLARRNESLQKQLQQFLEDYKENNNAE